MPSHDFVKTNDILYSDQLTHFAACMHSCIGVLNLTSEDTAAAINDAVLFGRYITYANTVAAYGKNLLKGIKQLQRSYYRRWQMFLLVQRRNRQIIERPKRNQCSTVR